MDSTCCSKTGNGQFYKQSGCVLFLIYLDSNNIENIHSFHKIPNLRYLGICIDWLIKENNPLSEASCTYICNHSFKQITQLTISCKYCLIQLKRDSMTTLGRTSSQSSKTTYPNLIHFITTLKEMSAQRTSRRSKTIAKTTRLTYIRMNEW